MAALHDGTIWERHGNRGADTVVMIHGLGLNRQVWQWMLPALSDSYDVITYDLCGHGESAAPPERPSLELFAHQLNAVLDAAGVETAAIVGFSLGGMICRKFAQDFPDRAGALVILNSPHKRTDDAQAAILKRVDQAATEGPSATVDAALGRWFTDSFRRDTPAMMDLVRSWVTANDKTIYSRIYRVLAEGISEITNPDSQIKVPTLVITGEQDYGNGPEMTQAIASQIPGARTLILPGLRHMALVEDPDAVNIPVRAFLDGLPE